MKENKVKINLVEWLYNNYVIKFIDKENKQTLEIDHPNYHSDWEENVKIIYKSKNKKDLKDKVILKLEGESYDSFMLYFENFDFTAYEPDEDNNALVTLYENAITEFWSWFQTWITDEWIKSLKK